MKKGAQERREYNSALPWARWAVSALSSDVMKKGPQRDAEAVSILRPFGESQQLAYALGIYAFNLGFLGRLDEAYEAGEEARKIARGLGDGVSLSSALGALGLATLMSGDFEKTQEYIKEAKALIEELGSSLVGTQILVGEGQLHALMGDLEGAEAIYREADQRFQELGDPTQTIIHAQRAGPHAARARKMGAGVAPLP